MKSTGMTRKLDVLGRIVIPKELRGTLDIDINDPLEVYVDNKQIILKKYNPGCVICESMGDSTYYKGQRICQECLKGIKSSK